MRGRLHSLSRRLLGDGSRGAVSLVLVVAVGLSGLTLALGRSATSAVLNVLAAQAWLPGEGAVTNVDAADGGATVRVELGGAGGHPVEVIQTSGGTVVFDPTTGRTWSLDDSTYAITGAAKVAKRVVLGQNVVYGLDERHTVQAYDAVTLAPIGGAVAVPGADLREAVVDGDDVLWLSDPSQGQVLRVTPQGRRAAVPVGGPARLALVQGDVAAVVPALAAVKILVPEGVRSTIPVPGLAARPMVTQQVEAGVLGILDPRTGRVTGVDLTRRTVSSVQVAVLAGLSGDVSPAVVGSSVYVVAPARGVLVQVNTGTRQVDTQRLPPGLGKAPVARARGGAVFVSSTDGADGLVIGTDGEARVVKLHQAPTQKGVGTQPEDLSSVAPVKPPDPGTRKKPRTADTTPGRTVPGNGQGTSTERRPRGGATPTPSPSETPQKPARAPEVTLGAITPLGDAVDVAYTVGEPQIATLTLRIEGGDMTELRADPAARVVRLPLTCGTVVSVRLIAVGPGGTTQTEPVTDVRSCDPAGRPGLETRAGNGWYQVLVTPGTGATASYSLLVDGGRGPAVTPGDWSPRIEIANGSHTVVAVATTAQGARAESEQTTVTPEERQVRIYDNYGSANRGYPVCNGNPSRPESMPGGTVSQTTVVPAGISSLHQVQMQIDWLQNMTAQLQLRVNGQVRTTATASSASGNDPVFNLNRVQVKEGDTVEFAVTFNSSFGKLVSVYTAGTPGGTFRLQNNCSDGAPNVGPLTSTGLRAVIIAFND
jgi:plastocyanin